MMLSRTAIGVAAALSLAGAAQAGEDGPMATAGASGAPPVATADAARVDASAPQAPARPLSTAEQIDAFIKGSPAAAPSPDEMAAIDEGLEPDRQVHGSVEVGVGTHGYRHGRVEAHYPVGKTGQVSIAVGATRGRGLYVGPYGPLGGPFGGPWDEPW
ncbi:hypothetical protein ACO2Q0_18085 [Phenylobacterium sp. VNQ135]|uniref:hypothetical protein n=1 Tax=Phenylobacterium sp. VNQ135 TaxID=3400922 RepID=UPI003C00F3B9